MTQVIAPEKVPRSLPDSVRLNESFVLRSETDIAQQYFELYKHRLQKLRPCLEQLIRQKWGSSIKICPRVLDCQHSDRDEAVIIGTCFKDQKKKANPLEDGRPDDDHKTDTVSDLIGLNISNSDFLMLEDEYGSLKISGACFAKHRLLTGITLAVKGTISKGNGVFIGTDYLLCNLPAISPLPSIPDSDDKYVAFISGLEISKMDSKHSMSIEMLFNYLSGYLGDALSDGISSKICRVLFAGNIISEELPDEDQNTFYDTGFKKNEQLKIESIDSKLKELDCWLSQLCLSVHVDIMPGLQDPSDHLMPQQPFHQCLFPLSSALNTFKRVTNPYSIEIDDRLLLGTSGQNFHDMMKHSELNMIECMELSLKSRIIAPTAPDTLSCFPFRNNDPFLISRCPHVYFSGNHDSFDFKIINHADSKGNAMDVCLLQIPSFIKTKQIVLFNLKTMRPQVMQLGLI
eukprot:214129_1